MSCCESYISGTHDVNDDVTGSQSRSIFKIAMSSIFELKRRSKRQNIGNQIWYQIEAACNILAFSIWPPFWRYSKLFLPEEISEVNHNRTMSNNQCCISFFYFFYLFIFFFFGGGHWHWHWWRDVGAHVQKFNSDDIISRVSSTFLAYLNISCYCSTY